MVADTDEERKLETALTSSPSCTPPKSRSKRIAAEGNNRRDKSPTTPRYNSLKKSSPVKLGSTKTALSTSPTSDDRSIPPVETIETSDTADEEEVLCWKSPPSKFENRVLETDYYRNPTLLSRLILNQKYGSALQRLYNYPREARIWICSKRAAVLAAGDGAYSIRQLPIHMACNNLVCTHDSRAKRQLNELIATLVTVYPEGAHLPDHRDRLPLHEALWYGADPETLSIFFMSKPESLLMRDSKGRSLSDLNRYRSGLRKNEVQKLLKQGLNFWRTARDEAFVRLKHGGSAQYPSKDGGSVSSSSVLASSYAEEESLRRDQTATTEAENSKQKQNVSAIAWDQLEKRALTAERILAETVEQNYELSRRVEALSSSDEAQSSELLQEITRIGRENTNLNRKIRELERVIKTKIIVGDNEEAQQQRLALAEVSSLIGLSEVTSLTDGDGRYPKLTREIRKMGSKVARHQEQQREQIRKVRFVVESMIAGSDSHTSVSGLTNNSHDDSDAFETSTTNNDRSTMIVDRMPEHRDIVDNLELIFRYAAAYDYSRRFPRAPDANDEEDLSAMLKTNSNKSESNKSDHGDSTPMSSSPPEKNRATDRRIDTDIELPALLPPDEIEYINRSIDGGLDPIPMEEDSI